MLHIILGILKIIGIIIGLLFLLLVCTMLAILFVPVRYRGKLVRKEDVLRGELQISWFLRAVSAAVSIGMGEKLSLEIRLFGIRLPFGKDGSGGSAFGGRKKRSARKNSRNTAVRKKEKPAGSAPEVEKSTGGTLEKQVQAETEKTELNTANAEYAEETDGKKAGLPEQITNAVPEDEGNEAVHEEIVEPEHRAGTGDPDQEQDNPTPENLDGWPPEESAKLIHEKPAGHSMFRKMTGIFRKLKRNAEEVLKKLKRIYALIESLPEKAEHLAQKLKGLLQKPEQLLALIQEYEVREIMSRLFDHLKYLLRHYGLRRIEGYLKFGTGDPALTGQLTGLIYLLLPERADQFILTPDFYEAGFETEIIFSGYIRSCHVLRVGWSAFRDKKLRRLIRKLRKRGE